MQQVRRAARARVDASTVLAQTGASSPPLDAAAQDLRKRRLDANMTGRYNRMLDVCAKTGDLAGVERIFASMPKDRVLPNGRTHALVVSACQATLEAGRARQWLQRMASVNLDLSACAHADLLATDLGQSQVAGTDGVAEPTAEWVQNRAHDLGLDLVAVRALQELPTGEAWRILEQASVEMRNPSSWVTTQARKAGAGRRTLADAAIRVPRGCNRLEAKYHRLFERLPKGGVGTLRRIDELLEEMRIEGVRPVFETQTRILACFGEAGAWDRAEKWLTDMEDAGLWPDAYSYQALIIGCAKACDVERAEAFLRRADSNKVSMKTSLLNSMLTVYSRAEKANVVEQKMNGLFMEYGLVPDQFSFNIVLSAYSQAGDEAGALATLEQMKRAGKAPDAASFTPLLKACANGARAEEAENLLQTMVANGANPDVVAFNACLHVCVKAKDLARLWRVYDAMVAAGVAADAATYTTLAMLYARCGDVERVEDLMFKSQSEGHQRGQREYSSLISACANAWPRDVKRAERLFREMVSAGIRPGQETQKFLAMALGADAAAGLLRELGVQGSPASAAAGR